MIQNFEINKKRVKRFRLTCSLTDDNGKVHYFQDGHEYVEIGGLKWATCNVGAEKETDRGQYFSWGDTQGYIVDQVRYGEKFFGWEDYKYGNGTIMTKYNSTDGKRVLEASDDAARFHMGGGWRMPTVNDFDELLVNTTREWATINGVSGMLFTSKTDSSKTLFFPACGLCEYGSINVVGSFGMYWSSSLSSLPFLYGKNLIFSNRYYNTSSYSRYSGFSVRGVFK